jgi:hypothetical protein
LASALSRRETLHRDSLTITTETDRAADEQRRAALGYLIWPAAVYEQFVEREPASSWYRRQVKQAVRFGAVSSIIGLAALLWPLILSLLFGNLTATLVFYVVAIALDIALFVMWLKRALGYSKRAARGETFSLQPLRHQAKRTVPAKN